MLKKSNRTFLKILLLVFLCCSGCNLDSTLTPTIQEPLTITPSLIPPTPTRYPTVTISSLPALTVENTITPVQALPQKEAEDVIKDLIQENGGCRFPCWWGFSPGMTTGDTMKDQLMLLDSLVVSPKSIHTDLGEEKVHIYYEFTIADNTYSYLYIDYELKENILQETRIFMGAYILDKNNRMDIYQNPVYDQLISAFRLPNLLMKYGEPEEVFIQAWPDNEMHIPLFAIVIIYPDLGIAVRYEGLLPAVQDELRLCANQSTPKRLVFWKHDNSVPYKSIEELTLWGGDDVKPIDEAAAINITGFYSQMITPEGCVQTPYSLWGWK